MSPDPLEQEAKRNCPAVLHYELLDNLDITSYDELLELANLPAGAQCAVFVCVNEIIDPMTKLPVHIHVFQDLDTELFFGLDRDFLHTLKHGQPITSPLNGTELFLLANPQN